METDASKTKEVKVKLRKTFHQFHGDKAERSSEDHTNNAWYDYFSNCFRMYLVSSFLRLIIISRIFCTCNDHNNLWSWKAITSANVSESERLMIVTDRELWFKSNDRRGPMSQIQKWQYVLIAIEKREGGLRGYSWIKTRHLSCTYVIFCQDVWITNKNGDKLREKIRGGHHSTRIKADSTTNYRGWIEGGCVRTGRHDVCY